MKIHRKPIDSKYVISTGYDEGSKIFEYEVERSNRKKVSTAVRRYLMRTTKRYPEDSARFPLVYRCHNFPKEKYEEFLQSESKGRFIINEIKKSLDYEEVRVENWKTEPDLFIKYKNSGEGIEEYKIEDDYIILTFSGNSLFHFYKYTYYSVGIENLKKMKELAIEGKGLMDFIKDNKRVYKGFVSKW